MINLAFITPHSPLLIPSIAKKNINLLERTSQALEQIKDKILSEKIETIIIISPHKKNNSNISINNHFEFKINFEEFGDYSKQLTLPGDLNLAYRLKEVSENDFNITLQAQEEADYGANIPLFLLSTEPKQEIKKFLGQIVIINTSTEESLEYHFQWGQKISQELKNYNRRIAIIASAELSHRHKHNSPGGFYQRAALFDEKTIENIKKGAQGVEEILKTSPQLIQEAQECGLRPLLILLGIINKFNYQAETLAYQKDLGIGYLTMELLLHHEQH